MRPPARKTSCAGGRRWRHRTKTFRGPCWRDSRSPWRGQCRSKPAQLSRSRGQFCRVATFCGPSPGDTDRFTKGGVIVSEESEQWEGSESAARGRQRAHAQARSRGWAPAEEVSCGEAAPVGAKYRCARQVVTIEALRADSTGARGSGCLPGQRQGQSRRSGRYGR